MSDRPILLVGCPRSGTTLLSAVLHAHPDLAVPPETRFLLTAYYRRRRWDLNNADGRRGLGKWITREASLFDDLGLSRRAVLRAAVDSPPTFGSVVSCAWRLYADQHGASRWVEKRPAYWREMPTLLRLFPDAQVIHLVRDPRAVVASLMRMPWYRRPLSHAAALWIQADRQLRRLERQLPPGSYHRVRYEDLLADPRPVLEELCRFLDEPFSEQMLDHAAAAANLVPARKTWHDAVRRPIDRTRTDTWTDALDAADVGLIEFGARRAMRRNGYSRSATAQRPTRASMARLAVRVLTIRGGIWRLRTRDAALRRRHPVPLAAERPSDT